MTGRQGRTEIRHEGVQRRVGQSRRRGFGGMGMRGRFAGMGSQRQWLAVFLVADVSARRIVCEQSAVYSVQ